MAPLIGWILAGSATATEWILENSAVPDPPLALPGWNKVQQVALVNASGFSFMVHSSAFLVHRPHPRSEAQGIYSAASSSAGRSPSKRTKPQAGDGDTGGRGAQTGNVSAAKVFHRRVAAMRHVALRDMRRGIYEPVVDEGSAACRQ